MTIVIVAAFLLICAASTPAHAYLDPGSGSMFLQLLLGGLAGLMLAVKVFWHRILTLFGVKKKDEKGEGKPEPPV